MHNQDQPGHVAEVTGMLAKNEINIATMQLYRSVRGSRAVMVIECDQEVPETALDNFPAEKELKRLLISVCCRRGVL